MEVAKKHECDYILCNELDLHEAPKSIENFQLADFYIERGFFTAHLALVIQEHLVFEGRFMENIAQNRGIDMLMFTSEANAMAWLKELQAKG